jgi:hypothetical protein
VADLTPVEKRKLERALNMGTGYVLGFSNRTFDEFFSDYFSIDISAAKYVYASGSKANRMRAFWTLESNYIVGRVLMALFDDWAEFRGYGDPDAAPAECVQIAQRLLDSAPAPDLSAIIPSSDDRSFDALARMVREAIERNQPETGLDRLHTFVAKYFRSLCEKRGIDAARDKPLHGLVGEYIKALRSSNEIESEMTERILKSSISVLDSFNYVRNNRSLAHDNEMLGRDEALLIFGYVTALIRFVQSIEAKGTAPKVDLDDSYDIPF